MEKTSCNNAFGGNAAKLCCHKPSFAITRVATDNGFAVVIIAERRQRAVTSEWPTILQQSKTSTSPGTNPPLVHR